MTRDTVIQVIGLPDVKEIKILGIKDISIKHSGKEKAPGRGPSLSGRRDSNSRPSRFSGCATDQPAQKFVQKEKAPGRGPSLSGRRDSNSRPPAPKAGALPDCATPRNSGESGIRTRGTSFPVRQFSKLLVSATHPSHRVNSLFFKGISTSPCPLKFLLH